MKLYFTLIFSLIFCLQKYISAQPVPTFAIIKNGIVENVTPYADALTNADMSNYRLLNKKVKIIFDNGVAVELFSAKELSEKGVKINLNEFREEFPVNFQMPEFTLKEGYVIAMYKSIGK